MKSWSPAILLSVAGWIGGAATGVAAFGTAISGAFVFGPMAMVAAWVFLRPTAVENQQPVCVDTQPGPTHDLDSLDQTVTTIFAQLGWMCALLWNLFAHGLRHAGLLVHVQRQPWLLFGFGVVLMLVLWPMGLLFAVCFAAASQHNATAQTDFLASKTPGMPDA